MTKSLVAHWHDTPDATYRVHVDFADGTEAWTTIDHAADVLDFIDRDKGIADLEAGLTFRSSMGSWFRIDR